jgi:hypothetical protein
MIPANAGIVIFIWIFLLPGRLIITTGAFILRGLSQSIIINEKWVRFLGVLAILLVFEFINLVIHPRLSVVTNHSPFYMLLVMAVIASLIIPLHHRLEHWIVNRMVRKNKRLRLVCKKNGG